MAESPQPVPAHRAREYETIYILRPNAGEEAADKVAGRVVEVCGKLKGKLVEVDVWGRRRLAYKIKGHGRGVFYYLRYLGYPGLVQEIERNLRMLDGVLKFQSVKLKDEIDPATVEVDPEAIKFAGVDFSDEPDDDIDYGEESEDGGRGGAGYLDYEPEPLRGSADDDDDDDVVAVGRDEEE
jgi:small subunit ribosomal protein S6